MNSSLLADAQLDEAQCWLITMCELPYIYTIHVLKRRADERAPRFKFKVLVSLGELPSSFEFGTHESPSTFLFLVSASCTARIRLCLVGNHRPLGVGNRAPPDEIANPLTTAQ